MQIVLGHDGPPRANPFSLWDENLLTGKRLTECPLRTILRAHESNPKLAREVDAHLRYYGAYDRGVLLVAGGISDQPARYVELMDRIDQQKNLTEAKHLDLMRKNGEETN